MDTDDIQDVVNQPEIANKQRDYGKNPTITDQNIAVMLALASGKTTRQLAKELGVTDGAISWHKAKFRDLVQLKASNAISDPINDSRARISGKLKRFERVLDYTVKPEVFKRDVKHLAIAAQTSIAGLKGLGVLVDRQESTHTIDVIATARESAQQRFAALQQFRYDPNRQLADVEAELISTQTADNQPSSSVQVSAVVPADQPDKPTIDIDPTDDRPAMGKP